MSFPKTRFHLERPLMIYALVICFILAPFANIAVSMIGFGVRQWYAPASFLAFAERTSWVDRSWLLLTLFAGLCLLRQRRTSWILAILSLVIAGVFNFYYGLKFGSHLGHTFFPTLFMLSNFSVVIILYYFRFPYIDRREAWWGMQPRYRCRFEARAGVVQGTVTDLSLTGAFLEARNEPTGQTMQEGTEVLVQFGPFSALQAQIIRKTELGYGLQLNPSAEQRNQLKQLISGLELKTNP